MKTGWAKRREWITNNPPTWPNASNQNKPRCWCNKGKILYHQKTCFEETRCEGALHKHLDNGRYSKVARLSGQLEKLRLHVALKLKKLPLWSQKCLDVEWSQRSQGFRQWCLERAQHCSTQVAATRCVHFEYINKKRMANRKHPKEVAATTKVTGVPKSGNLFAVLHRQQNKAPRKFFES